MQFICNRKPVTIHWHIYFTLLLIYFINGNNIKIIYNDKKIWSMIDSFIVQRLPSSNPNQSNGQLWTIYIAIIRSDITAAAVESCERRYYREVKSVASLRTKNEHSFIGHSALWDRPSRYPPSLETAIHYAQPPQGLWTRLSLLV